jgi:hypothetical protein
VQALLNDNGLDGACSANDLFKQAVADHEAGEWVEALRGFSTVLRLEPGRADAAFNIAATLQMLGFTRLAVHYTEKVSLCRTHRPVLASPSSLSSRPVPPLSIPPNTDLGLAPRRHHRPHLPWDNLGSHGAGRGH